LRHQAARLSQSQFARASQTEVNRLRVQQFRATSNRNAEGRQQNNLNRRVSRRTSLESYDRLAFQYDPTENYINDKVKLDPLVPPPEPLKSLLEGTDIDSNHFLQFFLAYSNCFRMTSFGPNVIKDGFMPTCKVNDTIHSDNTTVILNNTHTFKKSTTLTPFEYEVTVATLPTQVSTLTHLGNISAPTIEHYSSSDYSTLQIQDQIYHLVGSLVPISTEPHQFLQIYFIACMVEQLNVRCNGEGTKDLKRSIIERLQVFFHANNELVAMFKTALDRIRATQTSRALKLFFVS
jgi:hypothetical protein